jgi:hypothetical protein
MRSLLLLLLTLIGTEGYCQVSFENKIATLSPELNKFVIEGYTPLDTAFADLNRDGSKDAILVLKRKRESESQKCEVRPLLILIGQKDKSYKLALRSDKAIACDLGRPALEGSRHVQVRLESEGLVQASNPLFVPPDESRQQPGCGGHDQRKGRHENNEGLRTSTLS